MQTIDYQAKHRRGSSPYQEKGKRNASDQMEFSFSDHHNGSASPTVDLKKGRHEKPTEQAEATSDGSAAKLNNQN